MNKRKYKRKEKPFMIRFRTIPSTDWDIVNVKDLSAGGIFFHHTKDLAIGMLLDLKIHVPTSMLPINCVGEIIRIDKLKSTSMYGIAVKFTEIGEQEKELINKAVEELLE